MSQSKSLSLKSLFVLLYNFTGGIVGYVTMFFALKFVGQTAWGILGSAIAISGLLGIIANFGTEQTHIKKLTQKDSFEECMGAMFILKSFLSFLFLGFSFLAFFILGDVFGFKFESPYLRTATYIAILGTFLGSFSLMFKSTYQSRIQARRSITPQFAQLFVQDIFIILFSIYYKFNPQENVEFVGVLFAFSFLLGHFAKLLMYSLFAVKDNFRFKKPSFGLIKEYVLFSVPLALSGFVALIQAYTDRTMLQFFWNSTEVGGYFAVQKLALFIVYIGASLTFFLFPKQSQYYEERKEDFYNITYRAERYLSIIATPFVFFIFAMAPELLNIYRSSMVAYSLPLIILSIYAYLTVIIRPYSSQITSANKPAELLRVGLLQATLNVLLNAMFIPKSLLGVPMLGMKSTGAALATLLSFTVGFIYLRYRIYKILKMKFSKSILLHLFAGTTSAALVFGIKYMGISLKPWYAIVIVFLIFSATYLLLLKAVHEIKDEDVELIKDLLGPFSRYIYKKNIR